MTIGKKIARLRKSLGMTQVYLADRANITSQMLSKYETDIVTNIPTDKLERIAEDYIFSDDGKKLLTNRRYITLYDNYKKQTGIKCTAHQLRHSFATKVYEMGLDFKDIQSILGHKQISTTMDIYTDFRDKRVESIADKLNDILSKNEDCS